jgi:CRP-like cAMP-binding protein
VGPLKAKEAFVSNRLEELKRIFLFRGVSDPVLAIVADVAREVSLASGETLVSDGDPEKALYVIRRGTIRASREKHPSLFLGPGDAIGVIALIDGGPMGLTAVALERVDVLLIERTSLAEKLAGNYEAEFELYRAVARSLAANFRRSVDDWAIAGSKWRND